MSTVLVHPLSDASSSGSCSISRVRSWGAHVSVSANDELGLLPGERWPSQIGNLYFAYQHHRPNTVHSCKSTAAVYAIHPIRKVSKALASQQMSLQDLCFSVRDVQAAGRSSALQTAPQHLASITLLACLTKQCSVSAFSSIVLGLGTRHAIGSWLLPGKAQRPLKYRQSLTCGQGLPGLLQHL